MANQILHSFEKFMHRDGTVMHSSVSHLHLKKTSSLLRLA